MKNSTRTYFEIAHGNGVIGGRNEQFSFDTKEEAVHEAIMFKQDPRCHNPKMGDDNVRYWKSQTFVIVEKTVITTIHEVI